MFTRSECLSEHPKKPRINVITACTKINVVKQIFGKIAQKTATKFLYLGADLFQLVPFQNFCMVKPN